MPSTGYIAPPTDPLPLPGDGQRQGGMMPQVDVQPAQAQPLPGGAGYVSKSGAGAYIATQLLNGWMAGRMVKQQREQAKAVDTVKQSKAVYDTIAGSYRDLIRSGVDPKDPKAQQLQQQLSHSWSNYLDTAGKYAVPEEDKTKKKSVGQKVKSGASKALMLHEHPELIAQSSLQALRQSGPPDMNFTPSPEDQVAKLEVDKLTEDRKRDKRWADLVGKGSGRTKEENAELDGIERVKFPQSKAERTKDSLMEEVLAGKSKTWSPEQRQLAEGMGIVKRDQITTTQWKDAHQHDWLISLDESGKEVGRRDLGRGYVPPDQAAVADRIMQNQIHSLTRLYKQAHQGDNTPPAQIDRDANAFALMSISGLKGNPVQQERQQYQVSDAIKQVIGEMRSAKDGRDAVAGNFIVAPADDPNGLYFYRSSIVDPQDKPGFWSSLFGGKEKYFGGVSKDQLGSQEQEFLGRLRVALKRKNPKATDADIEALMPKPIYAGEQAAAGAKPQQKTAQREFTPTPKDQAPKGQKPFMAVAPDGSVIDAVSEEEKTAMESDPRFRGVTFQRSTASAERSTSSSF